MEPRPLGPAIKAALIAGVLAAMLVALFHFVVTEPVIEQAIALEEAIGQATEDAGMALVVSRDGQRAGLFLGFLVYGVTWAMLVGVVYHVVQSLPGSRQALRQAILVVLLTGWSAALFPFLKYPANPPGVGDPATIEQRQVWYVVFIALSIANTLLAVVAQQYLGRQHRAKSATWSRRALVGALYVAGAVVLFVAMPANLDAVTNAADLVATFRMLSFAGLVLFWLTLAGFFGWLARNPAQARTTQRVASARTPRPPGLAAHQ